MKESKLTPFDAETILMIKSVTGHEPEITEKAELFEMRMYDSPKITSKGKETFERKAKKFGFAVIKRFENGSK